MQNTFAVAMPGPFELIILLAMILIPLAVLFVVVYLAVKLATKTKNQDEPPRE